MRRISDVVMFAAGLLTAAALLTTILPAQAQPAAPASAASAPPTPTPGMACGAGGIGYGSSGKLVARKPGEAPDLRIDAVGVWQLCKPCLPAKPEAFRTWAACTSALANDSNPASPARDRVLQHGETGSWRQWTGPMRGHLIESCSDGTRTVVAASCAPATECDTRREVTIDGKSYAYDARPRHARVPVGGYAQAVAADGTTLRLQCVAGSLAVAPEVAPTPRPTTTAKPITCGSQSLNAGQWRWVYVGARVDIGAVVTVERRGFTASQDGGGVKSEAVCMPTGQLKLMQQAEADPDNLWNRKP